MAFTPLSSLGGGSGGLVTQGTIPWVVGDGGGSLTVDGPLTDAQLRATPVPVSGTVTALQGTIPWDTDGLTDAELRATPVPVSATIEPPEGAATDDTLGQVLAEVTGSARLLALLTAQALDTDTSDLLIDDGETG